MDQHIVNDVQYRAMQEADLHAAHRLSQQVKWPHRLEDWQFVFALGRGYVAQIGDQVVATALCWEFGDAHATFGMVIVAPDKQGGGLGKQLMHRLLASLDKKTVFLIATEAGRPLYEKLGFASTGSKIMQHQGAVFDVPLLPPGPGERIRPVGAADKEALGRLWSAADGFDRSRPVAALLEVAEGVALDCHGEMCGFAFYRRFGRGHVIGPVVAASEAHARALISHWAGNNVGMFIRIDIRSGSGLGDWLSALGMPVVDTVQSMARGAVPAAGGLTEYAICNQALG